MEIEKDNTDNRVVFFDNLRFLLVLCVVLQHASLAYNHTIWWPVADSNTSIVAGLLSSLFDSFTMPLLFYISGYFALSTMRKKGLASTLKGKLKRLGIPWIICILTICPILPLIYHYTRDNFSLSVSYWDLWLTLMKNAAEFNIGIIPSMNMLMQQNQFYQRYMWFLSLLLLFFMIFSLLYWLKKSWFEPTAKPALLETPSTLSTIKLLLFVGFLTSFCSFIMIGIMLVFGPELSDPEPLFTLGNVIQFRPSRLPIFAIYFGMGIITFRNKWIERGKFPGDLKTWVISFIIIMIGYLYALRLMLGGPKELEDLFGPIFFVMLNLLTISSLGLFTSLVVRYWNRPTPLNRSLASNSYNVYLTHYIFVLTFQLLLFTLTGIPGLMKFGIVSVSSLLCSYAVSEFFVTPYPRLAAASAITLFIIMASVIHP